MKGLIRSTLVVAALAVVWSFVWFQEDGVVFFVPGLGGWFISYGEEV